MTDRELLEFAAKAAGLPLDYTIRPDGKAFYHSDRNALALADGGWFAPLTDDGDALRLAVKLRITPMQVEGNNNSHGDFVNATGYSRDGELIDIYEDHRADPYAATRRAIVRAAAAIGKEMP